VGRGSDGRSRGNVLGEGAYAAHRHTSWPHRPTPDPGASHGLLYSVTQVFCTVMRYMRRCAALDSHLSVVAGSDRPGAGLKTRGYE
jgi:hypothetical protein